MSLINDLDKMFAKMDMNIKKKQVLVNDVYEANIQLLEASTYNHHSHDTLCEERCNMSRILRTSLEAHMEWANKVRESEMANGRYKTDGLKCVKQNFYERNSRSIAKLDDYVLALKTTKKIPANIFDKIFLARLEKQTLSSNRSLYASINLLAKDYFNYSATIDVDRKDQFVWVRDVISLNENNFLVVLNSFKHQDKLEIIAMNGEFSVFPEFLVSTSKYKILAPKNTNRIILMYAKRRSYGSGFFNKNLNRFITFIQIYDYKLNLLVTRSFDECYDEILANGNSILIRSNYDSKLVIFDFNLNTKHISCIGKTYDDSQLRHFQDNLVYFGKTIDPFQGEHYKDIFVIYDLLENRQKNVLITIFLNDHSNGNEINHKNTTNERYYFDRDSNICIFGGENDTLQVFDKFGIHLYTNKSTYIREAYRKLTNMQNWSVQENEEITQINAFNMNNILNLI